MKRERRKGGFQRTPSSAVLLAIFATVIAIALGAPRGQYAAAAFSSGSPSLRCHKNPALQPGYDMSREGAVFGWRNRAPAGRSASAARSVTGTSLNMFMGSDGGLLGVGGPELVC